MGDGRWEERWGSPRPLLLAPHLSILLLPQPSAPRPPPHLNLQSPIPLPSTCLTCPSPYLSSHLLFCSSSQQSSSSSPTDQPISSPVPHSPVSPMSKLSPVFPSTCPSLPLFLYSACLRSYSSTCPSLHKCHPSACPSRQFTLPGTLNQVTCLPRALPSVCPLPPCLHYLGPHLPLPVSYKTLLSPPKHFALLICHPSHRVGDASPASPTCLPRLSWFCFVTPDLDDPLVPFALLLYLPVPHLSSPWSSSVYSPDPSSLSILTGLSRYLDAPLLPPTISLASSVTGPPHLYMRSISISGSS